MSQGRTLFNLLNGNPDIQLEIENHLTPTDQASLTKVCKATLNNDKILDRKFAQKRLAGAVTPSVTAETLFKKDKFNSRLYLADKNLKQTANLILRGKMKEALARIDEDPSLLTIVIPRIEDRKIIVRDNKTVQRIYLGRTLYQLALGAGDAELANEMAKRFEKLPEGDKIKAEQYTTQFPNGVKTKASYRQQFAAFVDAIKSDTSIYFNDRTQQNVMNKTTQTKLRELQNQLTLQLTGDRKTGMHMDLQMVHDFVDVYNDKFNNFTTWKQRYFYWRCVFGWMEKFFPDYFAMVLSERAHFWGVLKGKKSVTRSTTLHDGSDFFSVGLGDSFLVYCGMGIRPSWGAAPPACPWPALKNFCESTATSLGELKREGQSDDRREETEAVNQQRHRFCSIV